MSKCVRFLLGLVLLNALACLDDPDEYVFPVEETPENVGNNSNSVPNDANNENNSVQKNNLNNANNVNNINNLNNLNNLNNSNNANNVNNVTDMGSSDMAELADLDEMPDDGGPVVDMKPEEDMAQDMCVVSNGGVEICDGRDNDCDGVVDNGAPFDCPMQQGACQGATTSVCDPDSFACSMADYGADFEPVETTCDDQIDNDCDGLTDCDDPDCMGKVCGEDKTCTPQGCVDD